MATGRIRAANADRSERLQRVLSLLSDGREHTTLNIIKEADVCAVNSAAAELRANGYVVRCRCIERGRWAYQLIKEEVQ